MFVRVVWCVDVHYIDCFLIVPFDTQYRGTAGDYNSHFCTRHINDFFIEDEGDAGGVSWAGWVAGVEGC